MLGTVLLHLFAAALGRRSLSPETVSDQTIPSLYIPLPSPFSAMEDFIDESAVRYRLRVFRCPPPDNLPVESVSKANTPALSTAEFTAYPDQKLVSRARGGEGMRQALELYKVTHPSIDAILVGTRRGDPHGGHSISISLRQMIVEATHSKALP
jgi:FAD synthetase